MNIALASIVDGLTIPPLLIDLIQSRRWQQPSDAKLRQFVPFLREPVDFLPFPAGASTVSVSTLVMLPHDRTMRIARGSVNPEADALPWLDFEKSLWLAINRYPGDDLGIVLDYRINGNNPRVIANDWDEGAGGCVWREVAPSFTQFAESIGF